MDVTEVIPGLFIASRMYPVDEQLPAGVVIDCAASLVDSADQHTLPIELLARATRTLLHEDIPVILMCDVGRNRSAVVAARALILMGMPARDSVEIVREARAFLPGGALTNQAFVDYLLS